MSARCPECRAIDPHHHGLCSKSTIESARRLAHARQREAHRLGGEAAKLRRDRELWHGKYAIVKHENNKLRARENQIGKDAVWDFLLEISIQDDPRAWVAKRFGWDWAGVAIAAKVIREAADMLVEESATT